MTPPQQPKFCVNCRWCLSQVEDNGKIGRVCEHPKSEADKGGNKFDLVTGEEASIYDRYRACGTMRGPMTECGPDAKLWEER